MHSDLSIHLNQCRQEAPSELHTRRKLSTLKAKQQKQFKTKHLHTENNHQILKTIFHRTEVTKLYTKSKIITSLTYTTKGSSPAHDIAQFASKRSVPGENVSPTVPTGLKRLKRAVVCENTAFFQAHDRQKSIKFQPVIECLFRAVMRLLNRPKIS